VNFVATLKADAAATGSKGSLSTGIIVALVCIVLLVAVLGAVLFKGARVSKGKKHQSLDNAQYSNPGFGARGAETTESANESPESAYAR
jgi:hypothetical protein